MDDGLSRLSLHDLTNDELFIGLSLSSHYFVFSIQWHFYFCDSTECHLRFWNLSLCVAGVLSHLSLCVISLRGKFISLCNYISTWKNLTIINSRVYELIIRLHQNKLNQVSTYKCLRNKNWPINSNSKINFSFLIN